MKNYYIGQLGLAWVIGRNRCYRLYLGSIPKDIYSMTLKKKKKKLYNLFNIRNNN
jgi:hypothetical protein